MPNEQFISGGYAMDTVELVEYFKRNYPQRHQITGTIQTYQELVLSKLNVHDRKMFSMLKKAISFEPINDIENSSQKMSAIRMMKTILILPLCRKTSPII